MSKAITTRLDAESLSKLDEMACKRGIDRASLIKGILVNGLRAGILRDSLDDYAEGKITLWEAAQRCDLSLWEMIQEVKKAHVHAPYDAQELMKDLLELGGKVA